MVQIDYYKYWNKKRGRRPIRRREIIALEIISKILKKKDKILDAGCGNGDFMKMLLNKYPELDIEGIDYSQIEVKEAKARGLNVRRGDFSEGIPSKNGEFDIVYAGEIIEHLYNPDLFLSEANRIIKKGGYLVISTPNLCAWFNRIIMLLGIQPLFLEPSTKSKFIGAGFLKRFKKEGQPVGHVRIFNYAAIKDILEMNGFRILQVRGAIFDEAFPKSVLFFDKFFEIFPRLAANFVILAKKI
jgi:2-polyprenyl-3-methyl-5-hydroxy-6-metoxy-1,4-benzoquinol methylase